MTIRKAPISLNGPSPVTPARLLPVEGQGQQPNHKPLVLPFALPIGCAGVKMLPLKLGMTHCDWASWRPRP